MDMDQVVLRLRIAVTVLLDSRRGDDNELLLRLISFLVLNADICFRATGSEDDDLHFTCALMSPLFNIVISRGGGVDEKLVQNAAVCWRALLRSGNDVTLFCMIKNRTIYILVRYSLLHYYSSLQDSSL